MSKLTLLLAAVALLLGLSGAHLYTENNALAEQIVANSDSCKQEVSRLKTQYQAEIDDLRNYLLRQYNFQTTGKTEKPKFNKLLSNRHRVQALDSKYEFLLNSALVDEQGMKQLKRLLFEWERVNSAIKDTEVNNEDGSIDISKLQSELAEIDSKLHILLQDDLDYEHFLMLRERDL